MAVRMKDIARDLGVSVMTVSKALRNHSDISEKTRDRVLARARKLGYEPNWIARSLVTRRTHMVGLVIPDLMHSFFAEVAKGVTQKFQPLGYQIVISNSDEDPEQEESQIQLLLARHVDGLIIASAQPSGKNGLFQTMRSRKVPYVLIDRLPQGLDAHFVGIKNEEIGLLATAHLLEQGCQRIAHIHGPSISTGSGRMQGYQRALAKAGVAARPEYMVSGHHEDGGGYVAMRQLLGLNPRPDGVFCFNDPVAAGAMKAILEAGLRIPNDIAVVGVGNVHYSDQLRVPLTTVDQSSLVTGERSAEMLAQCIRAGKPLPHESIYLPPKLVVRESSLRK
jgi:LacI family transcriptional regulator